MRKIDYFGCNGFNSFHGSHSHYPNMKLWILILSMALVAGCGDPEKLIQTKAMKLQKRANVTRKVVGEKYFGQEIKEAKKETKEEIKNLQFENRILLSELEAAENNVTTPAAKRGLCSVCSFKPADSRFMRKQMDSPYPAQPKRILRQ